MGAVPSIFYGFFFFFLKLALVSGYIYIYICYFLHLLIFCLEMIFCVYQNDAGQHHSLGVGFKHCFFKNSSELLEGLLPKKLRCPLKNNAWETIRLPFESWPLSLGTFVCFLECSQFDKDVLMFLPQSRVPTSYRPLGNLIACDHRSEILEKLNKVSSRRSPPPFFAFFMLPLVLGSVHRITCNLGFHGGHFSILLGWQFLMVI